LGGGGGKNQEKQIATRVHCWGGTRTRKNQSLHRSRKVPEVETTGGTLFWCTDGSSRKMGKGGGVTLWGHHEAENWGAKGAAIMRRAANGHFPSTILEKKKPTTEPGRPLARAKQSRKKNERLGFSRDPRTAEPKKSTPKKNQLPKTNSKPTSQEKKKGRRSIGNTSAQPDSR